MLVAKYINNTNDSEQDGTLVIPSFTINMLKIKNRQFPIEGYASEMGDNGKFDKHRFSLVGFSDEQDDMVLRWIDVNEPDEILSGLSDDLKVGEEFDRVAEGLYSYLVTRLDNTEN
ncbi:hypothetical protein [Aliivibrio fischeri]|uniref:hypothetical protein n=1 Tax=Aliivibrio fischeri TaxID=668 RepID=UPI0012D90681|nr:hypothetical protein [Aliivibrio fischeri]MUK27097.1 hypothetical protein [Aliivibrio fischeri]MUK34615.1 hypothetical protein [Aliivibrio fischeri]